MDDEPRATEPTRVPPDSLVGARFSGLARSDTAPELALRRQMHRLGLRYRVQQRVPGLPRKRVDVVFTRIQLAVFVDGCFWHGCPVHGNVPKNNREWWMWKLEGNRRRDEDTNRRLAALGWVVCRVWEHENMLEAASRIKSEVARLRSRLE